MDRRPSVDIQARSRDEALRLALEQLGARAEDVTVEVLAEIENDFYGDGEVLLRVTRKGARNAAPAPEAAPRQTVSDDMLEEYEQLAKDLVVELLAMMAVEADVMAVDNPSVMPVGGDDPPTVFIDIMGRDLGLLIGRRGENLGQFQYLVNLLLNRQTDDWVRAIVDVEGYRIRREESLIGLAERVGRQVARNRRSISLEPMPPNERRVVHLTLQNQPDVKTESSGDEPLRRVTIIPT
jgi:spoIIIJ-associated protein